MTATAATAAAAVPATLGVGRHWRGYEGHRCEGGKASSLPAVGVDDRDALRALAECCLRRRLADNMRKREGPRAREAKADERDGERLHNF